jgi:hypothetical protein
MFPTFKRPAGIGFNGRGARLDLLDFEGVSNMVGYLLTRGGESQDGFRTRSGDGIKEPLRIDSSTLFASLG